MPYARINGVKLYYELHGESGEALVLVHGYTGYIKDWRRQLPAFSDSYRVLIVDNRGHGRSEAPDDRSTYTVEQIAADVRALVDEMGFERFHLLGHSMGGAVAQELALESPERLLSLTLHDTSDVFANAFANPNVRLWSEYRFRVAQEQGMAALAQLTSPFPPPPHMPAERLEETRERLSRMSVDAFIGAWEGLSAWPGTRDRANSIEAPALVVWGDLDSQFIIDGSQRLSRSISRSEVAIVPESGHSPQYERPELFNAALGAFLSRISEGAAAT